MHIVPVIDVRYGIAVRAVAGDRANYRALRPEDGAASVLAVAQRYREIYPFSTFYIADLDGIEGRGTNVDLQASLSAALAPVDLWIDSGGFPTPDHLGSLSVIGSESLSDEGAAVQALSQPGEHVLSLDFRGDDFLGPSVLLDRSELWPARVLVMTLARVGTHAGPDVARIAQIARLAPHVQIYAAGGVRDVADLRAVRAAGASGALIASALHAGKIKADDLDEIIGL